MDFIVDKENKRIKVTKKFAAPLNKVWNAWTRSEYLDQWWAPKPWKAQTKKMEFSEGGSWLYAMVGPEREEHWCRTDFQSVEEQKSFKMFEYFCDPEGNINNELPASTWYCRFSESEGLTTVIIEIEFKTLEDLEKITEMGFKEGFSLALDNLDELINSKQTG